MKFSGKIGFTEKSEQTKPGIYKPNIVEKLYTGDVLRNQRRYQSVNDQQNENLTISNQLSIISDLYMKQNWASILYVSWNGVNWKVNSIDISKFPRVIIDLGGVYNGKTSTT